jgi:ribosomal protein S18 acetylase RimI-like enzyme
MSRTRYRGAALLTGLVCLGWAWDLALGGGRVHALAWSAALVVVAGISVLAARAAGSAPAASAGPSAEPVRTGRPSVAPPAGQRPEPGQLITIRPATPEDLPVLVEVEVAADRLFDVAGYGETPGPASIDELAAARLLLVAALSTNQQSDPAEKPPIGYVRLEVVDGQAHIEGLSVRPMWMRRGIGTTLVTAACEWAAEQGFDHITLCTFAEVPWNGPFYAQLGFREVLAGTPELQALREGEARAGLDAMGRRCVMRKPLVPAAVAEKLPTE